jgi:transcriptional regulator with XRE-family HTH domain
MSNSQNIYQNSRKNSGFTQEQAAEFLNIDPRTLRLYESGTQIKDDELVEKMIVLYKDKYLGYQHARTSEIVSKYLPEIDSKSLSLAALQVICASDNYRIVQNSMVKLAADGKIDIAEEKEWETVIAAAQEVIKAAFILIFAKNG